MYSLYLFILEKKSNMTRMNSNLRCVKNRKKNFRKSKSYMNVCLHHLTNFHKHSK